MRALQPATHVVEPRIELGKRLLGLAIRLLRAWPRQPNDQCTCADTGDGADDGNQQDVTHGLPLRSRSFARSCCNRFELVRTNSERYRGNAYISRTSVDPSPISP